MDEEKLTYSDYARYARQSSSQILAECEVWVFHGTGPGGQGVNTADSSVRMRHIPTNITVVSRDSRSQFRNRQECLRKLKDAFAAKARPPLPRHRTKVPKSSRERRLADKRMTAQRKAGRRRVGDDEG